MKRLLLAIIGWLLVGQSITYAQDEQRALTMTEQAAEQTISLDESFRLLEDKYDVSLVYKSSVSKGKVLPRKVIEADDFQTALTDLVRILDLTYKQVGRRSFLISSNSVLQPVGVQETVTGTVTDAQSGETLPGVNVMVKGTTTGTSTDNSGGFELTVESLQDTLIFSFVGYQTREVPISGRTELDVTLQSQAIAGEELVVVGYGTQQRSDLTGSVSSVKAGDIGAASINSIDQGLAGRASGVQVTQTSGQPGAGASVQIRGAGSLQGGTQPLYVIDGLPIYPGSGTGPGNKLSPLSALNPSDIESIEILKDASATAIYGSRGSNGVVLITTKSGGTRDQVSFSASYGVSRLVQKLDVLEAYEYATLVNEAYTNDGMDPYYSSSQLEQIQSEGGTDWQDEVFDPAPRQNYSLNFAGGGDKTTYSITGNYQNEEGIVDNSSFERFNGRINLNRDITDRLNVSSKLTVNKAYSSLSRTGGGGTSSLTYAALRMNPVQPVYQSTGSTPPDYTLLNAPGVQAENPVASANELMNDFESTRLFGNAFIQYDLMQDLVIKSEIGVDMSTRKMENFVPDYIAEGSSGNRASVQNLNETMWINENTINYNTTVGESHSIEALGGISFQKNIFEQAYAGSQDFVNNRLAYYALEGGSTFNQPSSGQREWSLASYFGRLRYNFDDRYLVTLNGRVDGSSRFGKNNKYGFFPSAAIAWRLMNEDFMQDVSIFSDLKLRLSTGVTGNQEIGLYNALSTLNSNSYAIGRSIATGFYPNKVPNPDLKWEKSNEVNVGLDMGFFNDRLTVTSDYYYKKTVDLIYNASIPFVTGYSTALQNVGSIQSQGLELALESFNITGEGFNWNTSFNISFVSNEVIELGGEKYKDVGGGDGHLKTGSVHRLQVGKPISVFYGYVYDGIFNTEQELANGPEGPTNWLGGRKYQDLNGDGSIDATNDRTIIGDPNPDFYGGLRNTFSYGGFQLDVFMQFQYGNDILNYNLIDMELPTGGQNQLEEMKNHWSESNPDEEIYPKPTTNRSQVFSSRQIEDGSYLKLQNLTFGYNFPRLRNQMQSINNLRLYLSMTNYLTFTGYSGYDPDISYRGISNLQMGEDFNQYPKTKMIQLGLEIGF
ncbi:SusC/RagA family TonB-linked outer membrane protein [Fodinibius sediminis]|uniref:TonB-linked outer membrane protein, SusC/RagA family n=1 Tax=Fodinibius sediminis TaxID=1214077 RepID=A0A521DP12_9BACT|nr:TonB-dependent receptor [Fodinibius sediminis]SMO73446.1 TonB-linked outer membrane protein, SusC/RagA family [Fodinibius sediminis]